MGVDDHAGKSMPGEQLGPLYDIQIPQENHVRSYLKIPRGTGNATIIFQSGHSQDLADAGLVGPAEIFETIVEIPYVGSTVQRHVRLDLESLVQSSRFVDHPEVQMTVFESVARELQQYNPQLHVGVLDQKEARHKSGETGPLTLEQAEDTREQYSFERANANAAKRFIEMDPVAKVLESNKGLASSTTSIKNSLDRILGISNPYGQRSSPTIGPLQNLLSRASK